jgi:tetratricopeptide (TPR) repeat protein
MWLKSLKRALKLLEQHAPVVEQRRVLAVLAGIYRDRGLADQALQTYQQALGLYEQVEDALGHGRTLSGLAAFYLAQKNFTSALTYYQQAIALADKMHDSETLWQACWGLGCCAQANGDLESAEAAFRRSLEIVGERQAVLRTDEGKVTFLDSVQDIYDRLIEVCLDAGKMEPAWRAAEAARGQAIGDLLAARREKRHSVTGFRDSRRRPFADRQHMMLQMARGMLVEDEPIEWEVMDDRANRAMPSIPAEPLPESLPGLTDLSLPVAEALPDAVPATPAAFPPLSRLVFHLLPGRTAVFVVTPDSQVRGHTSGLGRDELAARIKALRQALQVDAQPRGVRLTREARAADVSASAGDPYALLDDLYAQLVAPVEQALPQDGSPLVIEPHGALWLLPFAALRGADGSWMADRWPILLAPSAEVLDGIRQEADYGNPGSLRALIVGNPAMPQAPDMNGELVTLSPLPGAEAEAKAVAAMFPVERRVLLLGSQATRQAVEQQMPVSESFTGHHGLADADKPNESFVALGDSPTESGLLKAERVARMRLPADLVCLSACQTGLGRVSGEGVLGLSRAFLAAGVRAVLVSLWSVNDEATAELISAFYRVYLALDDKALALQQAIQTLRAQPGYEHPRYWAPCTGYLRPDFLLN